MTPIKASLKIFILILLCPKRMDLKSWRCPSHLGTGLLDKVK
jgi:hypothetical protein